MNQLKTTLTVAMIVFTGAVAAADDGYKKGHKHHDYSPGAELYDYAKVKSARPIYREVEVSEPITECREEPVYHTQRRPKSAGGMLAGGLIGGIIGHQIGSGNGRRVATAVGTLIGAQIGHEAVNSRGHGHAETRVSYERQCDTRYRVGYERVIDGYDVTYKYRGQTYRIEMPYDPGKRIKMRIRITPVI